MGDSRGPSSPLISGRSVQGAGRGGRPLVCYVGIAVFVLFALSFLPSENAQVGVTPQRFHPDQVLEVPKKFKSMDEVVVDVGRVKPVRDLGCPNNCNEEKGRGQCDLGLNRCICGLGHGDTNCSLSKETLYLDHDMYAGLVKRSVDTSGWDSGGKLYESLVASIKPNLVVEVGVWKGSSACKLSGALVNQSAGLFIAVDTWLPVKYFWKDQFVENRWEDLHITNGWPTIIYTFLSNVKQLGLQEVVVPFPATSRVASDFLFERGTQAELIHIDAAHEYVDVKEDLRLWWRLLQPGGIMLGDDWSEAWPGVMQAVSEHARANNLEIKLYTNKWWIQKPMHPSE